MVTGSRPNLKEIDEKKVDAPILSIRGFNINLVNNVKY